MSAAKPEFTAWSARVAGTSAEVEAYWRRTIADEIGEHLTNQERNLTYCKPGTPGFHYQDGVVDGLRAMYKKIGPTP